MRDLQLGRLFPVRLVLLEVVWDWECFDADARNAVSGE
jgi:hypothetical protein